MSEKKKKNAGAEDVVLLEDLQPRRDVKGKGRRLLFGQLTNASEKAEEPEHEEIGGKKS